jgi:hypothetical protein
MMEPTASVVDVPLIEPPLAQTEVEISDVPVARVTLANPIPTDREVEETLDQLASPSTTEVIANTCENRKLPTTRQTPSPGTKRHKPRQGGRGNQSERSP